VSKVYVGTRGDPCRVTVEEDGQEPRDLPLRLDLRNASPTGFEWGYGGSGPAQLALAILADATGDDDLALRLHQPFKWTWIAPLPRRSPWPWRITLEQVQQFVRTQTGKDSP
jgi:hypothetical protein